MTQPPGDAAKKNEREAANTNESDAAIVNERDAAIVNEREVAIARAVVEKMLAADSFSRWLGLETLEVAPRRSTVRMTVRADMLNGLGGVHGGIVYSLADSAFSYATNNTGVQCVAIDCAVSYPAAVQVGDVLTAVALQETASNRLAFCNVTVSNQHNAVVGHFRGTVYRTLKAHFPELTAASAPTTSAATSDSATTAQTITSSNTTTTS